MGVAFVTKDGNAQRVLVGRRKMPHERPSLRREANIKMNLKEIV